MNFEQLMNTGWNEEKTKLVFPNPVPKTIDPMTVRIEFDGGARNVPGLHGFGMGYGSFRYNGGKPIRIEFNRIMSANAAEIWTLSSAINRLVLQWDPEEIPIYVLGDSTIAIKWCLIQAKEKATVPFHGKPSLSKGSSEEMKKAIESLEILCQFKSVTAQWHSRTNSVKAFGH